MVRQRASSLMLSRGRSITTDCRLPSGRRRTWRSEPQRTCSASARRSQWQRGLGGRAVRPADERQQQRRGVKPQQSVPTRLSYPVPYSNNFGVVVRCDAKANVLIFPGVVCPRRYSSSFGSRGFLAGIRKGGPAQQRFGERHVPRTGWTLVALGTRRSMLLTWKR